MVGMGYSDRKARRVRVPALSRTVAAAVMHAAAPAPRPPAALTSPSPRALGPCRRCGGLWGTWGCLTWRRQWIWPSILIQRGRTRMLTWLCRAAQQRRRRRRGPGTCRPPRPRLPALCWAPALPCSNRAPAAACSSQQQQQQQQPRGAAVGHVRGGAGSQQQPLEPASQSEQDGAAADGFNIDGFCRPGPPSAGPRPQRQRHQRRQWRRRLWSQRRCGWHPAAGAGRAATAAARGPAV